MTRGLPRCTGERTGARQASILVRATDQQGAMMPGVSITISSPVLISGR